MKIGITGGKGGTGKSTVATALAVELAKKNKILLLDLDVDCPNDHLILSIRRQKIRNIYQQIPKWDYKKCIKCDKCSQVCKFKAIVSIQGKYPIFIPEQCPGCNACSIVCPVGAINKEKKKIGTLYKGKNKNIDFISGELEPNQPVSEFIVGAVKKYIKSQEKKYDFILIDTAAGTHCDVIAALSDCDVVLAVTEPTPLGAHDLDLILQLTKILKLSTKIVLNKANIGDKNLIDKIVKKYRTEIIAKIPYKKSIIKAYSRGEPIKDKAIIKITDFIRFFQQEKK